MRALIFTYPATGRRPSGTTQHPLATSLEQGRLRRIDDEPSSTDRMRKGIDAKPSITDRLRTDIDEANEVKDAMLLLRRKEIRNLEQLNRSLTSDLEQRDRDARMFESELQKQRAERERVVARCKLLQGELIELDRVREQLVIKDSQIEAQQAQIRHYEEQVQQSAPELRYTLNNMSARLVEARGLNRGRLRTEGDSRPNDDRAMLHDTIEGQRREIEEWRAEAVGRGHRAVSFCWQSSVDEAVRREREKDAFVIKALRDEIAQLQAKSGLASDSTV